LVVGTHSLIQKDVQFGNLGFVIIDEQHRFGVAQRSLLLRGSTQITEQINAKTTIINTKQKTDLPYKELTDKIKGVIFDVFNKLGSGLQKLVYQEALTKALSKQNISFDNTKSLNVVYDNKKIGLYKPDFIIENKIILVITSRSFSDKTEEKQVWSYLKESGFKLAVLVNFNNDNIEIKYVVYDLACDLKNIDTNQRIYSPELAFYPHLLSMTATPIPRTLALAMYGDLELSILDEMPKGRQSIITKLVSKRSEDKMYDFIKKQIIEGRQAFIICPRIEDTSTKQAPTQISTQTSINNVYYDDKSNSKDKTQSQLLIHKPNIFSPSQILDYEVKAVKKEYERIKKIFPEFQIEMIHGKMKPKEKDDIMRKFYDNKIQILIATSVIEVGIDVPNATIMVIEGAEHFGLSQLHQFRGRVGRGEYQSYCFLFTESYSKTTRERLKAMLQYSDGFKLAEIDLHLRGPGEFFGVNQSGFPDLAMQALSDTKQLAQIHEEATRLINKDNTLQS